MAKYHFNMHGVQVDFDFDLPRMDMAGGQLPAVSVEYLIEYGIRRCLNDAGAGAKDDAERIAAIEARAVKLAQGTIRQGGGGARKSPEAAMAEGIAEERIIAAAAAKGRSLTKGQVTDLGKQYLAKHHDAIYIEVAKRMKAVAKADADFDLDAGLAKIEAEAEAKAAAAAKAKAKADAAEAKAKANS